MKISFHCRKLRRALWPVFIMLLCILPAATPAQPLAPISLDELAASASLIVVGTVSNVSPAEPENPYANTAATIQVTQYIKGKAPSPLVVRYPGPSTALPTRGMAVADNLPQYALQAGDQRLFLLEGGEPFQLAHLGQGMLPVEMLPKIQAALTAAPLVATLTTDSPALTPAQPLTVTVHLRNTSSATQQLRLPADMQECCRLQCWGYSAQLPMPPIRCPRIVPTPSEYLPVTLQPGEARDGSFRLIVGPTARLTGPQHAYLAAWVYALSADSPQPRCIATPPLDLTVGNKV